MQTSLIRDFLVDVAHFGSGQIHRKKFAYYTGRVNVTAAGFSTVLDEWEELGYSRGALHVLEWGDMFTFTAAQPKPAN